VLLLDEPASGLDPRARIEIRELLKELRRMGKTIIISSHILHELAELCTSVGIIEQGELLFHGPISEIVQRARLGTRVHIRVLSQQDRAHQLLAAIEQVATVEAENGELVVSLKEDTEDFSFLAEKLLSNKFQIHHMKPEDVNLETAFMRLTKGMVQ